jgi:hypothetical protein
MNIVNCPKSVACGGHASCSSFLVEYKMHQSRMVRWVEANWGPNSSSILEAALFL